MTNDIDRGVSANRSVVVRWVVATLIVLSVGLGGFLLRGDESSRVSRPTSAPGQAAAASRDIPEWSADKSSPGGRAAELPAEGSTGFAGCDEPSETLSSAAPNGWTRYAASPNYVHPIEFQHPSDWNVREEGDQIVATSSDGSRAFVAQIMPVEEDAAPMRDVFSMMQALHPDEQYSGARSVVIDGRQGCAINASGNANSGTFVLLTGDGFLAFLAAGHQVDADEATTAEAWSIIGSVRLGD